MAKLNPMIFKLKITVDYFKKDQFLQWNKAIKIFKINRI
jgi:hypothetical protein